MSSSSYEKDILMPVTLIFLATGFLLSIKTLAYFLHIDYNRINEYAGVTSFCFMVLSTIIYSLAKDASNGDQSGGCLSLSGISPVVKDNLITYLMRTLFTLALVSCFLTGKTLMLTLLLPLLSIGYWIYNVNLQRETQWRGAVGSKQVKNTPNIKGGDTQQKIRTLLTTKFGTNSVLKISGLKLQQKKQK